MNDYGISKSLVAYLSARLHEGNVSAARNFTTCQGTYYLTPLIGATLADSYWETNYCCFLPYLFSWDGSIDTFSISSFFQAPSMCWVNFSCQYCIFQLKNACEAALSWFWYMRNICSKLYLWGYRATEFDTDCVYDIGQKQPVVATFVALLVKTFEGDITLSGNSSARWYLNADVPELSAFIASLCGGFQPVLVSPPDDNIPSPPKPLPEPRLKTLQEIRDTYAIFY